jgi:response regulator of citrate/malate metabolism
MSKPADVVDAWVALYDTAPKYLQEGEKTITQISREMNIDMKTAKRFVAQWVEEGKLIEVGIRRSHSGRPGMAYKLKV